ncbi:MULTISPECIES: DUF5655 domain-containing protein [unclassified Desulfovibrio]|uniref:DUF5655 domain-containing protein n=1 Tax=unclassified Desulfovibrio TaxID=2593640 RepID=UPI0013ECED7C|nr:MULTISPECIES: DUF5655 domain-containing protein [unclassified Desulfovibrio]
MSDIKLFRFSKSGAQELPGSTAPLEKGLHSLMEKNLECFLGIRFVAGEYPTGKNHHGRIDTLGLDENGCPVILEYKRHTNENVINQGLYYLDWLLDHRAEFKLLVLERYGKQAADHIEWTGTRVLCIAGDFTKFDLHAVAQIGRNIELIRYKFFSDDLLLFELLTSAPLQTVSKTHKSTHHAEPVPPDTETPEKGPLAKQLNNASPEIAQLWDETLDYIRGLGEDVNIKFLGHHVACTRLKNFACLWPLKSEILLWLKLNPESMELEPGFTRDVSGVGHYGTGDLEVRLKNGATLAKALPLIERAYEES